MARYRKANQRAIGLPLTAKSHSRRGLRLEPLEDRRLLAVFSVTNLNDSGTGSLRQAIELANADPMADTIDFTLNGTINLASRLPTISNPVTIAGPGADRLTVDAGLGADNAFNTKDGFQIFRISDGTDAEVAVEISGITLTGSDPAFPDHFGGAIYNEENLRVSNSLITGNGAFYGGGIYSPGQLEVIQSTVSDNYSRNAGGGIIVSSSLGSSIRDSNILRNESANGGGIGVVGGPLTITGSTVADNSATFTGGGAWNNTPMTVINSTFSGNSAGMRGGGISSFGDLAVNHSTVTGNRTTQSGGGIEVGAVNEFSLANSIVSGNEADRQGWELHSYGMHTLDGINLIGDNRITTLAAVSGFSSLAPTNVFGTMDGDQPTDLAAIVDSVLAENGGPTLTLALPAGSPALNAGDATAMAGSGNVPLFDQRGAGFDRVVNGRIDLGAIEMQSSGIACDFDADGSCGLADIDALVAEIAAATHGTTFDMTGDGLVDLDDRDQWLADAGALNLPSANPYLIADANLDGAVDVGDFNLWNANKFTTTAAWSAGDFNADGLVDISDFNLWNANKFQVSDSANQRSSSPSSEPNGWDLEKQEEPNRERSNIRDLFGSIVPG